MSVVFYLQCIISRLKLETQRNVDIMQYCKRNAYQQVVCEKTEFSKQIKPHPSWSNAGKMWVKQKPSMCMAVLFQTAVSIDTDLGLG